MSNSIVAFDAHIADGGIHVEDSEGESVFAENFDTIAKFLLEDYDDEDRGIAYLKVCYDLNEFKRFLFETRFFDIYDVEKGIIERVREDEEELLSFGYRWVRFNLFGEDTLRLKDKTFDKILQDNRKKFDNFENQDRKD